MGYKELEITNHLGSVITTLSDRRLAIQSSGSPTAVAYYFPDMLSTSDYYAFGMQQPERNYSSGYRYLFGGQEADNEVHNNVNNYTAEYWQYDARLGRRWNTDWVSYPWQSPYACFNNNPVFYNDPLGLEGEDTNDKNKKGQENTTGTWETHNTEGYTGQSAGTFQLPEVEFSTSKDKGWFSKIGSSISKFWKESKFVAQVGGKIDAGVQAKLNVANVVKVKADFVSFELVKGKLDFVKMFDSKVYSDDDDAVTGTYIGENGVNVEQGLEAEASLQAIGLKDIGLGGALKHTFNTNNTQNNNVDYDILIGVPVLRKASNKTVEKMVSKSTKEAMAPFDPISTPKVKEGKKQSFYGAALILGVDVNIKLGFEY